MHSYVIFGVESVSAVKISFQNFFRPDFGHFAYFRWVFSALYILIFIFFVNFFTFVVLFRLYFRLNSEESFFDSRIPNISPIFLNAAYIGWTGNSAPKQLKTSN